MACFVSQCCLKGSEKEELARASHGIKGSAGTLGLTRLANAAAELEAYGRRQENPSKKLLKDFYSLLDHYCKQLQFLPPAEELMVGTTTKPLSSSRTNIKPDSPQDISKPRLLLVDADLPLRKPLIDMLMQEYSVIVANNADRGLELSGQELQPQLALINANLNHSSDGIELCQRIRRLPNGDEPGILLISDTSSEEEYQQGLAAGVIDFIQQPISHTLLRALLSRQVY